MAAVSDPSATPDNFTSYQNKNNMVEFIQPFNMIAVCVTSTEDSIKKVWSATGKDTIISQRKGAIYVEVPSPKMMITTNTHALEFKIDMKVKAGPQEWFILHIQSCLPVATLHSELELQDFFLHLIRI
ncbi:uncharacterized protein LOC133801337 [Humulus lupulus]|uniref:uncharacterized protein LOC133801337 n=1 Tax=Humulus lupulus TaxID=3486 RepID=UPI002B40F122|nr:uncharacterized protein LOC133801337 [Humulus lupulus]